MNEVPTAPPQLPAIPGYELEKFVGKGGMGVVYRARHGTTGRVVALKLISPRGASDEIARGRFVREIHALAAIKHPNIVPLYDAGDWHGFPYCTMEFVAGGTLSDHLDRIRADLDKAAALMAKVARGVARLHAAGILHRDLKPLNILLSEGDEPLVADFGLAKWVDEDSDLTVTGLPVGTRPYMAPEQTLGDKRHSTRACDVWSLGVTLYEVLTGQRPFNDDGFTGVYHFIRTAEPPPMTALSPDLPEALQAVVLKCLAKRPEDRYPSAAALADDLDRWLRREPVLATLPPPPTSAGGGATAPPLLSLEMGAQGIPKPKRRNRIPALGVALVLAAFGAATLFPKQPAKPPVTEKAEALTNGDGPHPAAAEKRERQFLLWAQELAAGKPVFLTDDKGRPFVDPVDEPERALQRDQWDEYHSFSRHGIGIANLLDIPLPEEYCVEADVAVGFDTSLSGTCAGIYVGRRRWAGLPFKFESVVTARIAPRLNSKTHLREVVGVTGMFSWAKSNFGNSSSFSETSTPWGGDNNDTKPRFARVRLEVRKVSASMTLDGLPLRPMPFEMAAKFLTCDLDSLRKREGFPAYRFEAPPLGNGIGIYCIHNTCVVRNLTVTKLGPKP